MAPQNYPQQENSQEMIRRLLMSMLGEDQMGRKEFGDKAGIHGFGPRDQVTPQMMEAMQMLQAMDSGDFSQEMATRAADLGSRGLDVKEGLGGRGLDLQGRGLDLQESQGARRMDIDESLGNRRIDALEGQQSQERAYREARTSEGRLNALIKQYKIDSYMLTDMSRNPGLYAEGSIARKQDNLTSLSNAITKERRNSVLSEEQGNALMGIGGGGGAPSQQAPPVSGGTAAGINMANAPEWADIPPEQRNRADYETESSNMMGDMPTDPMNQEVPIEDVVSAVFKSQPDFADRFEGADPQPPQQQPRGASGMLGEFIKQGVPKALKAYLTPAKIAGGGLISALTAIIDGSVELDQNVGRWLSDLSKHEDELSSEEQNALKAVKEKSLGTSVRQMCFPE